MVRHSPGAGDVHVTAVSDDMKTDQLSTGSADADAAADDDDDDDKQTDEYHINATGSSPSPSSQPPQQQQQQQQLGHRSSSWDDVRSSFQRFPALTQLHYNYSRTGRNEVELSAVDSSTTSNWTDSYSSSVNRLQTPCPGDSALSSSHMAAASRQFGYQSLFHGAAHQWYSTQTSPQTLLTWCWLWLLWVLGWRSTHTETPQKRMSTSVMYSRFVSFQMARDDFAVTLRLSTYVTAHD